MASRPNASARNCKAGLVSCKLDACLRDAAASLTAYLHSLAARLRGLTGLDGIAQLQRGCVQAAASQMKACQAIRDLHLSADVRQVERHLAAALQSGQRFFLTLQSDQCCASAQTGNLFGAQGLGFEDQREGVVDLLNSGLPRVMRRTAVAWSARLIARLIASRAAIS